MEHNITKINNARGSKTTQPKVIKQTYTKKQTNGTQRSKKDRYTKKQKIITALEKGI